MQVHVWTLHHKIIEYLNDCYALTADFLSGPSLPSCVLTGGTLDWGVVIWDILPHVSIFHPHVIITQIIYHRGRYTTIPHNQSLCDRRHVLISLPTTNGNCAFSLTCVLELLGLHLNWKAGKISPPPLSLNAWVWCFGWKHSGACGMTRVICYLLCAAFTSH